jgi:tRNA-splicing ligase RtcB (3'-phosphate/5'-hydroxy nucleic acid ligase)
MRVITGGRVPIYCWASEVEQSAIDQAMNAANLPFAIDHIALAPDAHPGYGVPIGSVIFAANAVIPYAVGVDIGCSVSLLSTSLVVSDLDGYLEGVLKGIAALIPCGNGPHGQHQGRDSGAAGFDWSLIPAIDPSVRSLSGVLTKAIDSARTQLGTLGGGNHFIELQADPEGYVFVMLHSGSRSVGKKVCDHWHKVALGLNEKWHSQLPDKELAYLPWDTDEARGYFADMTVAMEWAEQNHAHMLADVETVLGEQVGAACKFEFSVHHNYAAWESHRGRNGIVHRKGAVRARTGEPVLIPGSMGTASYIARGLGNPRSFETCQHGAGRARSRTATRKMVSLADMDAQMAEAGVLLVTADRGSGVQGYRAGHGRQRRPRRGGHAAAADWGCERLIWAATAVVSYQRKAAA